MHPPSCPGVSTNQVWAVLVGVGIRFNGDTSSETWEKRQGLGLRETWGQ